MMFEQMIVLFEKTLKNRSTVQNKNSQLTMLQYRDLLCRLAHYLDSNEVKKIFLTDLGQEAKRLHIKTVGEMIQSIILELKAIDNVMSILPREFTSGKTSEDLMAALIANYNTTLTILNAKHLLEQTESLVNPFDSTANSQRFWAIKMAKQPPKSAPPKSAAPKSNAKPAPQPWRPNI